MKPEAVHISGIFITAVENPGKPQLGHLLIEVLRLVMTSNGVFYLQMASVGSHRTLGRKKERMVREDRKQLMYIGK